MQWDNPLFSVFSVFAEASCTGEEDCAGFGEDCASEDTDPRRALASAKEVPNQINETDGYRSQCSGHQRSYRHAPEQDDADDCANHNA